MKIAMVHTPLTNGLGFIGTLVLLLCLGGCGGGSASTEQDGALSELAVISQGHQARLLDLRSPNVQSAIFDLVDQSGESVQKSPMLYRRLREVLNEIGAAQDGIAEADAGIDEVGRSSSGEVFVHSYFESHEGPVFVLFLHAFIDAQGRILGAPERRKFFVPEGRLQVSTSSYSDDLSEEITALSIFAVENSSRKFSLYAASLNSPSMQSSRSSTTPGNQRVTSGCLAQGTQVIRADGSKISIEKVTVGMQVVLNQSGAVGTVENTSMGVEPYPMIHLITSSGASILATRTHPFFTQNGPMLARDIKKGDSVMTMNGMVKLTSVEQEMFGGNLHNLQITPDPAITYPSFVANGFVVGDITSQIKLNRTKEQRPDDVILEKLPEEWHADFLSSKSGS